MKKIVVPIDGSDNSKLALGKAKEIAKAFDAHIVVINVVDIQFSGLVRYELNRLTDEVRDMANKHAEEVLDSAKELLSDMPEKFELVKLVGNAADLIIEYVNTNDDIDMVVIGSQGLGAAKRFFIGSVASKVIHHTKKPILVIR